MHGSDIKFYKYLSPDASASVLENRTLKWSPPKLFNDPFDFPAEFDFPFSDKEFASALMDELVNLVYGIDEPDGDINNPLFAQSMIARHNPKNPNETFFRKHFAQAAKESSENFKGQQLDLRAYYKDCREQYAVLCMSKKYDDLLMWAHYSRDHSGCVFKFRCVSGRPLCTAQKVNYVHKYPVIANLQDYVKHLTGQIKLDFSKLFTVFAFTKSKHWEYEEEWRCLSILKDRVSGFDYNPFIPEELEAVYLGCSAEELYRNGITALIRKQYHDTHLYKAYTDVQNFGLKFERVQFTSSFTVMSGHRLHFISL